MADEGVLCNKLIVLLFLLILFKPLAINGRAMEPNYKNGSRFISLKYPYLFLNPKRGDVIVFRFASSPNYEFVERIIGLPGESVKIQDGSVHIHNQVLPETYLSNSTKTVMMNKANITDMNASNGTIIEDKNGSLMTDGQELTIPANNYFVLGDNRSNSYDSRSLGLVSKSDIISKLLFSY